MPKGIKGFQPGNKCGKQFERGLWISLECLTCDEQFEVPEWDAKRGRKCCSQKCHIERLRRSSLGEKHWNWQGGITNRWDKLHNSLEYKNWRLTVWQRDYFCCQHCKVKQARSNPLHAHHIKPKAQHPDLILSIDNGLTLCRNCHDIVHYGRVISRKFHRGRH